METKFQTSFIPKSPSLPPVGMRAPAVSHAGEGVASIYLIIASILLVLSLAGVGGAYWYKNSLLSAQSDKAAELAADQRKFDASGGPTLDEVKSLNAKITNAQTLLSNHLALSGVFDSISRLTIESVRFMSLDLAAPKAPGDSVRISMQGYGVNLFSVAFQSDVLNALSQYGLTGVVKNPALTDPATDAKGKVSFGFSASIDPSGPTSLYYKDQVKAAAAMSAAQAPAAPADAGASDNSSAPASQGSSSPFGR